MFKKIKEKRAPKKRELTSEQEMLEKINFGKNEFTPPVSITINDDLEEAKLRRARIDALKERFGK